MFNTLRSIISDLIKVIRGSNVARTEPISKLQVEEWIHQYRAMLLKRDLDKGKYPNPDYIQEISELKVSVIDAAGNGLTSLGLESGEYLLRTDLTIPTLLDLNFKSGLMYIGNPIGNEIQFIPESRLRLQQYKKYTSKEPLAFLRNNYIYIISGEPIEYITVRGVFEIPPEVGNFVNPITNQPEFTYDSKYPIPNSLVPVLKQMILQQELKIEATAPTDKVDDGEHKLVNQ